MAGKPRTNHLGMDFFAEVDGWKEFIAKDPGVTFDGVEVASGENGLEIVKAYGKKGGDREEYTPAERDRFLRMTKSASGPQFPAEKAA